VQTTETLFYFRRFRCWWSCWWCFCSVGFPSKSPFYTQFSEPTNICK